MAGPYGSGETVVRDEARAAALVEKATAAMPEDPARAEGLLREALSADLFQARAHNNLGVLLLGKGDLYGAAHEFEWARKLLPGHPEPRVNLALTLERAGQVSDAEASYRAALEVYPGYMPALQGAARLAVAEGRRGEELPSWLDAIAIGGENDAWRRWARARAAELPSAR
ncbi:MAG: tetratricopeptide repeat protein [Planctomycetota bacterium]